MELINIVLFVLSFISIYGLGRIFLSPKLQLSRLSLYSLGVSIGLFAVTFEAFLIVSFANWIIFQVFFWIQSVFVFLHLVKNKTLQFSSFTNLQPDVIITIIFATIACASLVFPFGQLSSQGISLPGAHYIDSTWHLSLIHSLMEDLPPSNPLYSESKLLNYHYFSDLQIATIATLTKIPVHSLFFQIMGPLYFFLLASITYSFLHRITSDKSSALVGTLLLNVSSNWYYVVPLFSPSAQVYPSVAWVDFFSTKSVNYPLTFSLIILLVCLFLLFTQKPTLRDQITTGFLVGGLVLFKSHTALVLITSLTVFALLSVLRKDFSLFKVLGVSIPVFLIISVVILKASSSTLLFSPFWFIKVMYESSDRLNLSVWELKRQYMISQKAWLGIMKLYVQGTIIFLIINLGPLLLASAGIFKIKKNPILLFLFIMALVGFGLTMGFIYPHTAIVTIQFFYLSVVALSLALTIFMASFASKQKKLILIAGVIIWITSLPGVYYNINLFLKSGQAPNISPQIVSGINVLNDLPSGNILIHPSFLPGSYFSGYTGNHTFIGDSIILQSLSIDYSERLSSTNNIFSCDLTNLSNYFSFHNLKYIAGPGGQSCLDQYSFLDLVYRNEQVSVFSISN